MKRRYMIVEVNVSELAVRIAEAICGFERVEGLTAMEFLETMDADVRDQCLAAARAALGYFREQTREGHTLQ